MARVEPIPVDAIEGVFGFKPVVGGRTVTCSHVHRTWKSAVRCGKQIAAFERTAAQFRADAEEAGCSVPELAMRRAQELAVRRAVRRAEEGSS